MVFNELSEMQKRRFRDVCGQEYDGTSLSGEFMTNRANNDPKWEKHSPWEFRFWLSKETGNLVCWLYHRMLSGVETEWDREGNKVREDYETTF